VRGELKIENAEFKNAVDAMRWWLRWRFSKQVRELGDEAWLLRGEIESNPGLDTLSPEGRSRSMRRDEITRKLIRLGSDQHVRAYMRARYGLALGETILPRREVGPEPPPTIPMICPKCGPSEAIQTSFGMWDGTDSHGKHADGLCWEGHCRICGVKIALCGEGSEEGIGKEWSLHE
jgi:hypothetical protein